MANYFEMVSQSVIEGLRRANYDLNKFRPASIKAGFFADRAEVMIAEHSAQTFANILRIRQSKGEVFTPQLIEKEAILFAAESAYLNATGAIRIYSATGKNTSKFVQGAREALEIMKKYGHRAVDFYEQIFKVLIGEE